MGEGNKGQLKFNQGEWQAVPISTDGSFISPDKVDNKEVEITFRVFKKRVVKGVDTWDVEIGTGVPITITYCPGRPTKIVQVTNKR